MTIWNHGKEPDEGQTVPVLPHRRELQYRRGWKGSVGVLGRPLALYKQLTQSRVSKMQHSQCVTLQ
jgi:hypothetical protein